MRAVPQPNMAPPTRIWPREPLRPSRLFCPLAGTPTALLPSRCTLACPLAGLLSDGRPTACATPPGRLEDGAPL
eukprot:2477679-Prymnesium_polylepis.1